MTGVAIVADSRLRGTLSGYLRRCARPGERQVHLRGHADRLPLGVCPKAQNGPKALYNMVFRPKSLKI